MESPLFEIDLLTALEPGNPGGETPPSTAGETPAATEPPPLPDSLFAIPYSRSWEAPTIRELRIGTMNLGIRGADARRYGSAVDGAGLSKCRFQNRSMASRR